MKKSYPFAVLIIALGLLATVPLFAMAAPPQTPHMFYGNVTINGNPAPIGTIVAAKTQDGTERGSIATTELGKYGEAGIFGKKLLVQGEIATDSIIIFSVNGTASSQTFAFSSGAITSLDIAVSITVPSPIPSPTSSNNPVITPTPTPTQIISNTPSSVQPSIGGGGGGGGGGGSGAIIAGSSLSPRQLADVNKDGKIDIFDFNLVMVHWGETTPNNSADINRDGKVDILDFNLLMIHWT